MAEEKEKLNITIFGSETELSGELSFTDKLIIAGKFVGSIKTTGDLEIAKDASCECEKITAHSIVISGKVRGALEADERIEICDGSSVNGDVKTAHLRVADNVDFEGTVTMLDGNEPLDIFSRSSAEFKKALALHSDVIA